MNTHYYICSLDALKHISNTRIMYGFTIPITIPKPYGYNGPTEFKEMYGYTSSVDDEDTTRIILERMLNEDEAFMLTLQCKNVSKHNIKEFTRALRRMIEDNNWTLL